MSYISITNIISLIGGVALFLFGMSLMGEGLKKVAGNSMELILYRLSGTPIKGLLLGTGVTAAIQSSSATSVIVVGFVNAGMMSFRQAVPIIHGALIGTSITGWILCLSNIEGAGWVSLLSTANLSAIVAIIGILIRMISKKQRSKHMADILLGFSVLMFGMQSMSSAVSPLKDSEAFISVITDFSNPILGIAAGALFTAALQSASASVGILQALSMTGAITFATAFPVILGIAIGASVPVLISSMGARVDGRRTAWSYLYIEVLGVMLTAALYYGLRSALNLQIGSRVMNPVSVALVNTLFRVFTAIVLSPFNFIIIKLLESSIKENEEEKSLNAAFSRLDERFLAHPSVALEQSRLTVCDMACAARNNLSVAISLIDSFSEEDFAQVEKNEELVDRYEDKLGTYLVKINTQELDSAQNDSASKYLHTLSDFERMSDHATNIAELASEINEKKITFSEAAMHEMEVLTSALGEMLNLTIESFISDSESLAYRIEPLEEHIDNLCDAMKLNHIDRVQKGLCSINVGFVFNDLITNFERIADHCSNVAVALIELNQNSFATHNYVQDLKSMHKHNFDEYFSEYSEKYKL